MQGTELHFYFNDKLNYTFILIGSYNPLEDRRIDDATIDKILLLFYMN